MIRYRDLLPLILGAAASLAAVQAAALPVLPRTGAQAEPTESQPHPVFDERITGTLDLPTWDLQQARRRMLAGEQISWDDMRALADNGDGLAAFRFAQRIEGQGDPALLADAAFYYATAAYTNRDYAVGPLVRILGQPNVEFSPRRLEHIENALRAMALAGDAKAAEALTGFYTSGRPFGRQPEKALQFRLDLAEAGEPDAAMGLVLEAMSGSPTVALDEEQVNLLLDVVEASDDLGLRTTAANIRRMVEAGQLPARTMASTTLEDSPAEEIPE
jgi:TPR repeat protein